MVSEKFYVLLGKLGLLDCFYGLKLEKRESWVRLICEGTTLRVPLLTLGFVCRARTSTK